MSKELEALEKIDHTICINSNENNIKWGVDDIGHIDCVNFDEYGKCFSVVFEALKRNEPMKPIKDKEDHRCPKCGHIVDNHYCSDCGGAVDWGKENG